MPRNKVSNYKNRRQRVKHAVIRHVKPHHQRVKALPRHKRWLIYIFSILFIVVGFLTLLTVSFKEVKNPNYGVSFSIKAAQDLGVDWKANYLALLDDLHFKNLRLMSYWDNIEVEKGSYDFHDLDWQLDEAAKRGAKVSLSIGMRQPRWPECHKPAWYNDLTKQDQDRALFDYLKATIEHVKSHPAVESYQLENEAVNTWFGTCTKDDIDRDRLTREFNYVKQLDPNHPVWMSLSDQHGLPTGQPTPDKYGFSVYRIVWNDKTGPFKFYITYPTPIWYHRLRAWWIKTFKHRDIFIHELQVEPWGPKPTRDMTIAEQDRSMSPKQMEENISFARRIGQPDIYMWGGEWWYWRKTNLHDNTPWETVRSILTGQQNSSLYR